MQKTERVKAGGAASVARLKKRLGEKESGNLTPPSEAEFRAKYSGSGFDYKSYLIGWSKLDS